MNWYLGGLKPKITAARVVSVPFRGLWYKVIAQAYRSEKCTYANLLLSNWYLLGVEMNLGHTLILVPFLGVFSKFHPSTPVTFKGSTPRGVKIRSIEAVYCHKDTLYG